MTNNFRIRSFFSVFLLLFFFGLTVNGQKLKPSQIPFYGVVTCTQLAGWDPYDDSEVIQKLKIKNWLQKEKITQVIQEYNSKMESHVKGNKEQLVMIRDRAVYLQQEAELSNEFTTLKQYYEMVDVKLEQFRLQSQKDEELLNAKLKLILSQSQYNKWQSWQKKKKWKIRIKLPMPMAGPIL